MKKVVNANIQAAKSSKTGVFNIACNKRWTLNELVELLNQVLGKKIDPIYTDPRPGDIKHSLADINKAKKLGYNPDGQFIDELRKTAEHFT